MTDIMILSTPRPAFISQTYRLPTLPSQCKKMSPLPTRRWRTSMSARPRIGLTPERLRNGEPTPSRKVQVKIQSPRRNQRIICASNLIQAPMSMVWELLSDYGHLADHIPNLVMSRLRTHPSGGIRLEQCGAQKILGFEFRASLTMDMTEINPSNTDWRAIDFKLVNSTDFKEFHGSWRMERVDTTRTALFYTVSIVPKGLVPVRAIEWRISEDVPENLDAVRTECERRRRLKVAAASRAQHTSSNDSKRH